MADNEGPAASGRRNQPIIHAADLSKEFNGDYAVRNVTFDIAPATIFGFIGPSGSGKTTTVRLLAGLLAPTSGEVTVLGRPPFKFHTRNRENIGYMPQLFALYPDLTVWENLNFVASLYGMGFFRAKRLHKVLDIVDLNAHRSKLARNISGGMQRRLSLAATLVHDPDLIFLDEPTAGIDPILRAKFWDHFRDLKAERRTLFVTTQYVGEAINCDVVGIMSEGRLIAVNTPEGLRRQAFGGDVVELRTKERVDYAHLQLLRLIPGVRSNITRYGDQDLRLTVPDAATAIPDIMEWCQQNNYQVEAIQPFLPPFDDVFLELVNRSSHNSSKGAQGMPDVSIGNESHA